MNSIKAIKGNLVEMVRINYVKQCKKMNLIEMYYNKLS